MAKKEPVLPPCDPEIYEQGEEVCLVDGNKMGIEAWVKLLAKKTKARIDWHYVTSTDNRASVLLSGNESTRRRVLIAINRLQPELKRAKILSFGRPAL